MPDYKELFYQSQSDLADIEEELKRMVLKIQRVMRKAEEEIISENDGENSQKETWIIKFLLLDKVGKVCYNNKAVGRKDNSKKYHEKFQKCLKKRLDKLNEMWYNRKVAASRTGVAELRGQA